jgi:phage-related minor tail protein
MRGGTGLMGEAGPEAIMPLARGPDGKLGVRAGGGGGGPVSVVMNISTPDVEGFRRSRSQIAAEMARAMGRGRRNR